MTAPLRFRLVNTDVQEEHVIEPAAPILPPVDYTITFEVHPGEWLTWTVAGYRAFRYSADSVEVEIDMAALDDDEEAP